MTCEGYVPVFQRTRGGVVESVHFGAAAVVDSSGRLLASIGDPQTVTFMRSSAKPFQALPFVENGGPDHFAFTPKETALICASHSGTDDHVRTAARIQSRAGFEESDLQCGVHPPTDAETRARMAAADETPTQNRHNCSGKHSGMLACARMMGWPLENYLAPDHPLQQQILRSLGEMSDLAPEHISIGIDGCSAPNFAMPLYNAALAYARLADPAGLPEKRAVACREITRAMTAHPDMVAGPGKFDTCVMEAGGGRLVAKGGAEEYQGIGIPAGVLSEDRPGVGVALKISDGAYHTHASTAVALELLRWLGLALPEEKMGGFRTHYTLENHRGIEVGRAETCFVVDN